MIDLILGQISQYNAIDLFTIFASLFLFIAAKPICQWLHDNEAVGSRASMMRFLNFAIILAVIAKIFLIPGNAWISKIIQVLIVLYFTMLITQVINFFIRKRFGRARVVKNKVSIADTYSSRGLNLSVTVVITIISIVSCLRILGFNSVLEAGGALGIIGLFLAMTQASWAPDIISGLIILNSRLCEEGDVIQFNQDGKAIVASIFRTKLFHTECLDLVNNHRLMIRNTNLRDQGLQNLSRFASARGLRESLLFNIDYKHTHEEVSQMINQAFEKIDAAEDIREEQYEPEIFVSDTGDYAVTWAVYYYIKDIKRIQTIKNIIRSYILKESIACDISLSTPSLSNNSIEVIQPQPVILNTEKNSFNEQTKTTQS